MTKTMSDLPEELVAEILSRVPMTSLGSMRSTCKEWNALSRNWIFGKVAETKIQFLGFMIQYESIYSVKIDLQGNRNDDNDSVDLSIKHIRKEFEVYKAYHCDGLLLLWIRNSTARLALAVWNPYLCQTRFISAISNSFYSFALGYDKNRNHKVLFILDFYRRKNNGFNIYDFRSDSWRVLDLAPNWKIKTSLCVTLKGNAYFYAQEEEINMLGPKKMEHFLLCFDFTSERFGPRLSLPFHDCFRSNMILLQCVRDKQLAVLLYQPWRTPENLEIWVTNRIGYNEVSWTKWMQVDTNPVGSINLRNLGKLGSFFIDEEKKVIVVFDQARTNYICLNLKAHIIGQDGYFKTIDVGEYRYTINPELFGYFPSLVEIQ